MAGSNTGATRLYFLLGLAAFASMFSMRVCDSMVATFAIEFGISTATAARAVFGFAFAYGLMQLFYGPIGDRYGKLRVLNYAVASCSLFNAAILVAPTFDAVIWCRVMAGASGAGIIPLTMAWIGDTVPYSDRQAALNRLLLASISGMIAGQWGGGLVAQYTGWHSAFAIVSALFAFIVIALRPAARQLRSCVDASADARARTQVPPFVAQIKELLGARRSRQVLVTAALEGAFALGMFSMVPAYLQQRFHVSASAAGGVLALYGVGGLIFAFQGKRLLERVGEAGLIKSGGLCLGISLALLAIGNTWWWAIPACLLGGFGFYMLHSTLQTNATQMAPSMRGTAVSAFVACLFLGQSLGVFGASMVFDSRFPTLFYIAGAVVFPILGCWFCRGTSHCTDGTTKTGDAKPCNEG